MDISLTNLYKQLGRSELTEYLTQTYVQLECDWYCYLVEPGVSQPLSNPLKQNRVLINNITFPGNVISYQNSQQLLGFVESSFSIPSAQISFSVKSPSKSLLGVLCDDPWGIITDIIRKQYTPNGTLAIGGSGYRAEIGLINSDNKHKKVFELSEIFINTPAFTGNMASEGIMNFPLTITCDTIKTII